MNANDIEGKTNEELTNILLTVDGQGVKIKKEVLQELLDRVKKESYEDGFKNGQLDYNPPMD